MNDKANVARNNRLTIILLVAAFVLPVVMAWYLVFFTDILRGSETTEHGLLIEPPQPLANVPLSGDDDQTHELHGQWTMLTLTDSNCDSICHENLYRMRQIRLAMGNELQRVQRVLMYPGPDFRSRAEISSTYPGQLFLSRQVSSENFTGAFSKDQAFNGRGLYLIDPRGFLMMYYPYDTDPSGIIKDLKRLLRLSKTG